MARMPELSQAKLAKAAGTSQQQISKLINGEREMTAHWAEKLAPMLLTSPERLVFPNLKSSRAPLLSWVSAGKLTHQEGVRKSDVRKYLVLGDLPKGDWVVLEVAGDSMDRVAPEGSYICVNLSDQRLVNDKFYVFSSAQGDATFKRYRSGNPPRLQPYSTNPDHETLPLTDGMTCLGRVSRIVHDLT